MRHHFHALDERPMHAFVYSHLAQEACEPLASVDLTFHRVLRLCMGSQSIKLRYWPFRG